MSDAKALTTVNRDTGEITPVPTYTTEQLQLIKDTVAKGATDDELRLFLYTAKRTGLDPLTRQIHFIKRYDGQLRREVGTPQTGIDGFRVIAERSGEYAGQDAPVFTYTEDGDVDSATVTVYRFLHGERVAISATAFFEEYMQTTKEGIPNRMWSKMPRSQLAKCAEALALRKAFPQDLSGVYTFDEMAQADVQTEPVESSHAAPSGPTTTNSYPNAKCNFCGEKHLAKGATIVKVNGVWGSLDCLNKTPEPDAAADPEPERPSEPAKPAKPAERKFRSVYQQAADGEDKYVSLFTAEEQDVVRRELGEARLEFLKAKVTGEPCGEISMATPATVVKYVEWLAASVNAESQGA